ncbi:Elongator complex protein 5 [Taphrina deformans PYCC 5710]|uniref:Elongator complex protein 5 n=1 Tax=Taphrina deformans (strain PYCC 5710 / ATCC 11124 / CBS 356.35 / IMI 108563 / JCM 9778 / NBRC 8474) TaxID=1097556 RepID=R4XB44_TAPDE|nr:Elongator complex protein 5 [Taphrina deformans PYCC 5710]|eukprot:CCG82820.1 Elongator complex protein 5 [Taphrina deformans PYCC 5710]
MSVTRPTLLISRILQFKDISPLLILTDSIFQSAAPLLDHLASSARSAKFRVITINWRRESDVCTMTSPAARDTLPQVKDLDGILQEIGLLAGQASSKVLMVIPDLNDFLAQNAAHLSTFLSSLIQISPDTVSVCAIHHRDVPVPGYASHLPSPETLLQYLATTIIDVDSLEHVLLQRDAERRSRTSRVTLDLEGRDIFVPVGSNCDRLYLDLEHRRKSGRGNTESSVFDVRTGRILATGEVDGLEHRLERPAEVGIPEEHELGFKIGLSEKQQRDRDGVMLPHYVQIENGRGGVVEETKQDVAGTAAAGGGNIYYEPDSGDDFDAEDPDDDLML